MTFTSTTLPLAVQKLFEQNNYRVEGPVQRYGAEIDLVATPLADPFGSPIYIEATVEYVNNEKYGKDVTKFILLREKEPSAKLLIVSSAGFSLPVTERAKESRVETLTYQQLFSKFERFDRYIEHMLGGVSEASKEIISLSAKYEEPLFDDKLGTEKATDYLTNWRSSRDANSRWLIVVGEYGTGKTALTKVIHHRWLQDCRSDPSLPIPFRIELREFNRQFDARGLIHHFLDTNSLSHIPIEFAESLIRSGRALLILDGYDEMAQYLHGRERRACLEALAQLSAGGAKGILTSRPNYFTETEELQVFETLYASLNNGKYYLTKQDESLLKREAELDSLLEKFVNPSERVLMDLTPDQTEALVARALADDPLGRDSVLSILRRVFRKEDSSSAVSLSGKPVIITYLLEVVDGLKQSPDASDTDSLTEWQVYKLIVDQLMLRDLRRSALSPSERRAFLRMFASHLSRRDSSVIDEKQFKDLVSKQFSSVLRRHPAETREEELERLYADLRSSATLTREINSGKSTWRFSHNSLREYLVAESIVNDLKNGILPSDNVTISDAMRQFVSTISKTELGKLEEKLRQLWSNRMSHRWIGTVLTLLWDGFNRTTSDKSDSTLTRLTGAPVALNDVTISRLTLSSTSAPIDLVGANCSQCEFYDVDMSAACLESADFSGAMLDTVSFREANLRGAKFAGSLLIDIDMTGATVQDADFTRTAPSDISLYVKERFREESRLVGMGALGYLTFHGAKTKDISESWVAKFHPRYEIAQKIMEKLAEQTTRQKRGLEQRGIATNDVDFARSFLDALENDGLVETPKSRKDLVQTTDKGRVEFKRFVETGEVPAAAIQMLRPTS